MTALTVGTELIRSSDQTHWRLIAAEGRSWIAEQTDEWSGPVRLTPRALANYELADGEAIDDVSTPKRGNEDAGRAALVLANLDAARAEAPGRWALHDAWLAKERQAAAERAAEDAAAALRGDEQ